MMLGFIVTFVVVAVCSGREIVLSHSVVPWRDCPDTNVTKRIHPN